ncbi:MAG: hypothetical protein M1508_05325 [Nitrospirae bacterium]|nr:hypothetical protein [Nitrospirota bacterium]MCL5422168.1 hypothetical protein [Nitrospirota bacterium]
MPEFKNKEEYDKWKAERTKELGEKKREPEETAGVENNKEELVRIKDGLSGQVWNEKKDSSLRKITFLILGVLVFLGLFGISRLLLTPTGFIVKIGLPLLILIFSLLLVILSFVNLLKSEMEHFALSIRLLSIAILILVCSSVAFTYFQYSELLNHYKTLAEEKGRLALSLEDSINELKKQAEADSRTQILIEEYRIKRVDADRARFDAESKMFDAEMWKTKILARWDELFGAIFILFGNLGVIVLSLFSRKRS